LGPEEGAALVAPAGEGPDAGCALAAPGGPVCAPDGTALTSLQEPFMVNL